MTALAMACRLILYCHGSHVAEVTDAIDAVCRFQRWPQECRAALVTLAHNETRWYHSESAVRFSPWGLVSAAQRGEWIPGVTPYVVAASIARETIYRGMRHCGHRWPAAFAWYIRGDQRGRCPRVGPESRQRWQQMRGLLRR